MNAPRAISNVLKLLTKLLTRPADVIYFLKSYIAWQRRASPDWKAELSEIKTYMKDRHDVAGSARGHYFLQDIWAAQRVFKFAPQEHVDVGSRVDGFVAHVVSFCPVKYVDIREIKTGVPGLTGIQGSVCDLPFPDQSVNSLSCLHVIEHIGLGRYSDPVDPEGWLLGLKELQRVLKPGGKLLVGTPCGRQRVVLHAHRVFSPSMIINAMRELDLIEFSLIRDGAATEWIESADLEATNSLEYGCGLFVFTRPL